MKPIKGVYRINFKDHCQDVIGKVYRIDGLRLASVGDHEFLGIHRDSDRGWIVTHIPTGLALSCTYAVKQKKADCVLFCEYMDDHFAPGMLATNKEAVQNTMRDAYTAFFVVKEKMTVAKKKVYKFTPKGNFVESIKKEIVRLFGHAVTDDEIDLALDKGRFPENYHIFEPAEEGVSTFTCGSILTVNLSREFRGMVEKYRAFSKLPEKCFVS